MISFCTYVALFSNKSSALRAILISTCQAFYESLPIAGRTGISLKYFADWDTRIDSGLRSLPGQVHSGDKILREKPYILERR